MNEEDRAIHAYVYISRVFAAPPTARGHIVIHICDQHGGEVSDITPAQASQDVRPWPAKPTPIIERS